MSSIFRVLCFLIVVTGPTMPPSRAGGREPDTQRVRIEKFTFVPKHLIIRPGDKVEWINEDVAPHTATARDQAWNSGNLGRDQSAVIGFPVAGVFDYFCIFHPHMRGEILVVENRVEEPEIKSAPP